MNRLTLLLLSAIVITPCLADDQIRDAQTALKSRGFYFRDVDGAENAETSAAIRRFQIRNGLAVTGKLNPETLAALGLIPKGTAPAATPKPGDPPMDAQVNPPPVTPRPMPGPDGYEPQMRRGKDMLRNPESGGEPPRPARRISPGGPSAVEPPAEIPGAIFTPYSMLFRGTPYDDAPLVVQRDTLRRAQALLKAERHYQGPVDGLPRSTTSEALFAYQEARTLERNGRLDLETLAELHLLPKTLPRAVQVRPFYNPNRHRDNSVMWDYWAR